MTEQKTLSMPVRIHGAVVWILLGLVVIAGVLGTAATIHVDLPDWYMHLGMWGVLGIYVLLYLNSFYGRRRLRQWFNLAVFVGVSLYWMHVLKALVPAQTMAVQGEIVERAALPILWAPIALLVAADLLLIAHTVAIGRWRWESDPDPSRGPATVAPRDSDDD